MFYLVVYDIPSDKLRTELADALLSFGERVQESVFECDLRQAGEYDRMLTRIKMLINADKGDAVRIYRLCGDCLPKTVILGEGHLTQDADLIII